MDSKIIFIKTSKGEDEARNKTALLFGDNNRALLTVDGTASFGEISKRAAPSLRRILDETLGELEKGGFIQDRAQVTHIPRMVVPTKMAVPPKKQVDNSLDELDFTAVFRAPSPEVLAAEAVKAKAEEAAKLKAQQEAEAARIKAQQEAARIKAEAEAKARAEAEAKAREEAEHPPREEPKIKAEEAKLKAEQEAEAARIKAQQEAARIKAEADAEAKARAEAEAKARAEAGLGG